jgi:DNA-binding transcriptional LysR family regulator
MLRIGYVAASLPARVPRALQRLAEAMPQLEITLEPGSGLELVDAVRAQKLDAAVVSLPTPANGLRITDVGDQCAVAVFPVGHDHALKSAVRLDQIAPQRIIVLPRDADRPFYDSVIAACRDAGVSPTLIEMPDAQVERALLAVAAGAGMAVLPESVGERYAAAGVRFVPLDGAGLALATGVISRRDTEHMPTVAFLRSVSRPRERRPVMAADVRAVAA